MKLWLDDSRPMPLDYDIHVRTAKLCIDMLSAFTITEISLDHDLGDYETCGNGCDVVKEIEFQAHQGKDTYLEPMSIRIHSLNPVGVRRMEQGLIQAMKFAPKLILRVDVVQYNKELYQFRFSRDYDYE